MFNRYSINPNYLSSAELFQSSHPLRRLSFIPQTQRSELRDFVIEKIISKSPEEVWDQCKSHAGIDKEDFFTYFQGKTLTHTIQIKKMTKFRKKIDPKDMDPEFRPPQSFSYVQPGQELYEITQNSTPTSRLDAYF